MPWPRNGPATYTGRLACFARVNITVQAYACEHQLEMLGSCDESLSFQVIGVQAAAEDGSAILLSVSFLTQNATQLKEYPSESKWESGKWESGGNGKVGKWENGQVGKPSGQSSILAFLHQP